MADVETNVFRKPTESDGQYFDVDLNKPKRKQTAEERFEKELGEQAGIAQKKVFKEDGIEFPLPFATAVARGDRNEYIGKVKTQVDREGFLPKDFPKLDIDWSKYSDIKNFELESEGEVFDQEATKKNPGLRVDVKKRVYKFKGYGNIYTVMEDESSAIKRAQEKNWKEEKAVKN